MPRIRNVKGWSLELWVLIWLKPERIWIPELEDKLNTCCRLISSWLKDCIDNLVDRRLSSIRLEWSTLVYVEPNRVRSAPLHSDTGETLQCSHSAILLLLFCRGREGVLVRESYSMGSMFSGHVMVFIECVCQLPMSSSVDAFVNKPSLTICSPFAHLWRNHFFFRLRSNFVIHVTYLSRCLGEDSLSKSSIRVKMMQDLEVCLNNG